MDLLDELGFPSRPEAERIEGLGLFRSKRGHGLEAAPVDRDRGGDVGSSYLFLSCQQAGYVRLLLRALGNTSLLLEVGERFLDVELSPLLIRLLE
jgi:hypothetical protein